MKRQFSEETIVQILREGEESDNVRAVCRRYGITEQTYYRWRNRFAGMNAEEVKKVKELEQENTRMRKRMEELQVENRMLRDVAEGNF